MKIEKLKPNHICRNPNCHRGEDGGPKHFYACDYCNRTQSWRSRFCCFECFVEAKNEGPLKPKRTDKTDEEIEELMKKPIEEVKKDTLEELADYKDYLEENGLNKTIDFINEEIELGEWDE